MKNQPVGLAHELRRAQVKDSAIEMLADVSARLIIDFWADSKRVAVQPMRSDMGFKVFVDGEFALSVTPGATGDKNLRPVVCLKRSDNKTAVCDAITDAHELLGGCIVERLEQGDANAA